VVIWGWPQLTWLSLMGVGLYAACQEHGTQKAGVNDARKTFWALALELYLLCAGGFFG
jgi:hypothetical protein